MNISSVGATSPLLKQLEANGLSADKAKLVQTDLAASEKAVSSGTSAPSITSSVRAAFDTKIAADVSSGKLSMSDAVAVKKTMDSLGGGSSVSAPTGQGASGAAAAAQPSGAAGAARGGGGGGGGGSSNKTELSETVTVSGSTMTTVITYTDGTTQTTTATATDADEAKYGKPQANEASGGASNGYSPSIDKGSLIDKVA